MKIQKYIGAYFTAGLGTLGCSFLQGVSVPIFIRIVGIISLLICCMLLLSFRVKWPWLVRTIDDLYIPSIPFLALFLSVYGFSKTLIQANYILEGLIVVLLAYIVFGYKNGTEIGKSLRQICNKLNIFIPSMKIPKDI